MDIINDIIYPVLEEIKEDDDAEFEISPTLEIYGDQSIFDSISLVRFIVNLQDRILELTDKDIIDFREKNLAAERGETSPISSELILPNGKRLVNHLKSRFTDNEINSDTATIAVYAEYNNKDNLLIPGNYVDIRLGNKEDKLAILVPQASVAQDKHGNYVMVVGDDNIAYERRVVMGDTIEDKQIVLDGLKANERVIIQGLQKVSNGQKVQVGEIANNAEIVTEEGK